MALSYKPKIGLVIKQYTCLEFRIYQNFTISRRYLEVYVHGDKRRDSFNQNFRATLRKCLLGKWIEVPKGLVLFHTQEEIRSCETWM